MAPVLNLCYSSRASLLSPPATFLSPSSSSYPQNFNALSQQVRSHGRFSCLFSDNRKQEQARKALESALGGKKTEFEKWNKELKKREEVGGGGSSGGGKGWFGWWRDGDDPFWQEAQQTSLTVLALFAICFAISKGDVLFATIFNPLLFALRGVRNGITFVASDIMRMVSPSTYARLRSTQEEQAYTFRVSAKERALKKWGSD